MIQALQPSAGCYTLTPQQLIALEPHLVQGIQWQGNSHHHLFTRTGDPLTGKSWTSDGQILSICGKLTPIGFAIAAKGPDLLALTLARLKMVMADQAIPTRFPTAITVTKQQWQKSVLRAFPVADVAICVPLRPDTMMLFQEAAGYHTDEEPAFTDVQMQHRQRFDQLIHPVMNLTHPCKVVLEFGDQIEWYL